MPVEKPANFRGTLHRVLRRLHPERVTVGAVIVLALTSVAFAVAGPKLLGNATNILFEGVVGKRLPAGLTKEQVVEGLRARGDTNQADLIAGINVVPGVGVDFARLAQALLVVVAVYVLASLLAWGQAYLMAGVTQRVIYRLREDVDHKLGRLPLRYLDAHARGDLLSRVTNDIDNINTSLQQTLTQASPRVPTVIGVLAMMLWISPLLAVISLVTVPLSLVGTSSSPGVRSRTSPTVALDRPRSTATWRRCTPGTTSSRSTAGRRRPKPRSTRRTSSCTGRASGPSSSRGSSCRR